MRALLVGAALVAVFSNLLWGAQFGEFNIYYSAVLGLAGTGCMALQCLSGSQRGRWKRAATAAALALLTFATVAFNQGLLRHDSAFGSTGLNQAGDLASTASLCLYFAVAAAHYRAWPRSRRGWAAFSACALVAVGITTHFIIVPLQHAHRGESAISLVSVQLWWVIAAVAMVYAVPISFKVVELHDLLFLCSFIWHIISAFATNPELIASVYQVTSWAEPAWTLGICLFAAHAASSLSGSRRAFSHAPDMTPFLSVRALLGLFIFATNTLLLLGLYHAGMLQITTGSELWTVLLPVVLFWMGANLLGAVVSRTLQTIQGGMLPAQTALALAGERAELPTLGARSRMAEIDSIVEGYNVRVGELNELAQSMMETRKDAAIGQLAAQVSHDIRSPLAALSVLLPHLKVLPEELRLLLRDAIHRIQDIANTLLERRIHTSSEAEELQTVLLSSIVQLVASDRRTAHRAKIQVSIVTDAGALGYGLFAQVVPRELKRVLVNLINNAVESIAAAGTVSLAVGTTEGRVWVEVADTGCGMPAELMAKLGAHQVTQGKAAGNGLGVYHAFAQVQGWGGELTFESVEGAGTRARINLPSALSPAWFASEIWLQDTDKVVIIDDDVSVHHLWNERFRDRNPCLGFSSPQELENELAAGFDKDTAIYLIDYEFSDDPTSGLDLIERHALMHQAFLVTSHFEDAEVIARCTRLGAKMLPKPVAGSVPIVFA